ncbi:MAG: hypothetical protein WCK53_12780 [Methanomicrobiales archaeon]|jgi:hypothetical protein
MPLDDAEEELVLSPVISPDLAGQIPEGCIYEIRVHQVELDLSGRSKTLNTVR